MDGDLESRIRKMIGNRAPDSQTQLALAEVLFDRGDDVESVRVLRQLIGTDPTYFRARHRLIDTYRKLGRCADAAEAYREWGLLLATGAV